MSKKYTYGGVSFHYGYSLCIKGGAGSPADGRGAAGCARGGAPESEKRGARALARSGGGVLHARGCGPAAGTPSFPAPGEGVAAAAGAADNSRLRLWERIVSRERHAAIQAPSTAEAVPLVPPCRHYRFRAGITACSKTVRLGEASRWCLQIFLFFFPTLCYNAVCAVREGSEQHAEAGGYQADHGKPQGLS